MLSTQMRVISLAAFSIFFGVSPTAFRMEAKTMTRCEDYRNLMIYDKLKKMKSMHDVLEFYDENNINYRIFSKYDQEITIGKIYEDDGKKYFPISINVSSDEKRVNFFSTKIEIISINFISEEVVGEISCMEYYIAP